MASTSKESLKQDRERDERKCAMCLTLLRKVSGRTKSIETDIELEHVKKLADSENIKIKDVLCNLCRPRLTKVMAQSKSDNSVDVLETVNPQVINISESLSQVSFLDSESQTNTESSGYTVVEKEQAETIELPIPRTISTHNYCFICGYKRHTNIVLVPVEARIQTYSKINVFIPNGNRCCRDHLIKNRFYEDECHKINIFSSTSTIDVKEISQFLNKLSIKADESLLDTVADFVMPEKKLKVLTGLSWDNIIQLRGQLTSLKNSSVRTTTQAIVVFLFKLRTGNSNAVIAAVLNIEHDVQVSKFFQSVLSSFENDILPKNFGLENADREDLINNQTSQIAKKLHSGNELILIGDGTYIRHEKSSNNEYQRKSYSGQKKVPLAKPFTICTTNGHVVDMLGPYTANVNDAEILMKIFEKQQNVLQKLLRKGDIFVLDRGFRDIKKKLEEMGYIVLMPALKGKRSQLTTQESNDTRFTTKLRWVVEAVHGIIKKKYRLLDHKLDNKMLTNLGSLSRISCYLNNKFGKRLESDKDMQKEILNAMESRKKLKNTLAEEVEEKRWARRKLPFQSLSSSDIADFPELTEKDLKILFTGSYQLKQTVSYLAEMLDSENNLRLGFCKETKNILKIHIHSRHINKKEYKCFIEYEPNSIGYSSIRRYCCDCANGSRTVGCCAHVAAVIYYLSHGRYLSKIIKPAEILSKMFLRDEIEVCIEEDSDNDE